MTPQRPFNSQDDMVIREVPPEVVWDFFKSRGKLGIFGHISGLRSFDFVTGLTLPFCILTVLGLLENLHIAILCNLLELFFLINFKLLLSNLLVILVT